jgi:cyanophycinase
VLARGGAIGGSSAGASIQADYMVRGDPLGNLNVMAEGYERGFGFLRGVAIDQHFLKRKRTQDMTALMKTFPQLLGIGIDENTAVIVTGETLEVAGTSNVAIYDRSRPAGPDRDYELLGPGARYNLRARQRLADVEGSRERQTHSLQ